MAIHHERYNYCSRFQQNQIQSTVQGAAWAREGSQCYDYHRFMLARKIKLSINLHCIPVSSNYKGIDKATRRSFVSYINHENYLAYHSVTKSDQARYTNSKIPLLWEEVALGYFGAQSVLHYCQKLLLENLDEKDIQQLHKFLQLQTASEESMNILIKILLTKQTRIWNNNFPLISCIIAQHSPGIRLCT